jgi:predicted metal-dependent peptidase
MTFDMEGVRLKVRLAAPYFSSILFRMNPIPKPGIGTVAVDEHWNLYYDSDIDWSLNEQTMAVIHEIHHLTLNHHQRRVERRPDTWNQAGDCEINDGLADGIYIRELDETICLPFGIFPRDIGADDGLLAEEYYDIISQREDEQGGGSDNDNMPGCGGGAGNPNEWEDGPGTQPEDDQRITGVEKESIFKQVAEEVKTFGAAPGHLKRWAGDILRPAQVPWTSILKAHVRQAVQVVSGGETDYSYQRENIRHEEDFVLPSLISYDPVVAIGIDTSGSVWSCIDVFLSEVTGILRAHASEMVVVWGDTEVKGEKRLSTSATIRAQDFTGGGGTNMKTIIEHTAALRTRPNIIILLTDSETIWPEVAPRGKLIIVTMASEGSYWWNKHPAYAQAVHIEK